MNNKWVGFSPHIKTKLSTTKIYLIMMIVLCPAVASVCVRSGLNSLLLVAVSMGCAFLTDLVYKLIANKKYYFNDPSSLFIGLVIGLCMPTGAKLYVSVFGTIFAILFIRNMAGGIGQNFVSEIAVAILMSYLIFTADFYLFSQTNGNIVAKSLTDSVIGGEITKINFTNLLFGGYGNTIADSAQFWIILAGLIAMIFNFIDFRIPVVSLASTFLFACLFFDVSTAVNLMFGGCVIISAFFIATDYAVVPKSKWAKYCYALLIGFLTAIIWKFGNYQVAVFCAVSVMGLLSSTFNGLTRIVNRRN